MCGINGILWEDESFVLKMNRATAHRGPDGTAATLLPGATFGHNRLSVIDPDPRSNQPMQTEDGRYTITYNGEIYNFKELRSMLRSTYTFKTESDTEVILAGFKKWGTEVLGRLNGMYALAIHDRDTGEVVIARDPMGIKPLYVTKTKKGWAFSSEIKGLLELGISRELNRDAFNLYMRTLYVPAPLTLFSGVHKFPPGHFARINDGEIAYTPFTYTSDEDPIDPNDTSQIRTRVEEAITRQLISDRPLGVYLSGGIDSSSVLAAATEAKGTMETFSVGFELTEGEEPDKFNADSALAKRIAEHFGAKHHEFLVAPRDVFSLLESAAHHLDEPIGNATAAPQIALSKFARERVVVALTGDGGDEVFGGYPRYLLDRRMDVYQRLVPGFVSKALPAPFKKLGTKTLSERFALFHFQKDHELQDLLTEMPPIPQLVQVGATDDLMEADRVTWLVDEALQRTDKLGMAHGLEARPPLLDLDLVSGMRNVPIEKQVSLFNTKRLLKRAFQNKLPEWVLNQPKRGWFSPGAKWLRNDTFGKQVRDVLKPGYAQNTDTLFDWKGVECALSQHQNKNAYRAPALIAILMFQLWSKKFKVSI